MNKFLAKGSLALGALALCAAPGFAEKLTFTIAPCTGSSACVSEAGTTGGTLTSFTGSITDLGVTGGYGPGGTGLLDVYSALNLSNVTLTLTNNTTDDLMTLSGKINGGAVVTLLSFDEGLTTGVSTSAAANFGAVTNLVSVNSTLAGYLGIYSGSSAALAAGTNQINEGSTITSGTPISPNTNNVTSATFALSIGPTPEPASFLMFGTGLLGVGFMARRRASKKSS